MFINIETSVELIAATKQVCNECLIRMKRFLSIDEYRRMYLAFGRG